MQKDHVQYSVSIKPLPSPEKFADLLKNKCQEVGIDFEEIVACNLSEYLDEGSSSDNLTECPPDIVIKVYNSELLTVLGYENWVDRLEDSDFPKSDTPMQDEVALKAFFNEFGTSWEWDTTGLCDYLFFWCHDREKIF